MTPNRQGIDQSQIPRKDLILDRVENTVLLNREMRYLVMVVSGVENSSVMVDYHT